MRSISVNSLIRIYLIPLIIFFYLAVLLIQRNNIDDPDIKSHLENISIGGSVQGLVLGGSNSVFSISAEQLGQYTGLGWYNASLVNEMGLITRYHGFIRNLANRIDPKKVQYVIYSSQLPYSLGRIIEHQFKGERKIRGAGIRPKKSVLAYLMALASNDSDNWRRNGFGDLEFDSVTCVLKDQVKPPEHEDVNLTVDFLVDTTIFLASVFPNAALLIVFPSEYYGATRTDSSEFQTTIFNRFVEVLDEKYQGNNNIKIIFQPPYFSVSQVCDEQNHANEYGRLWRTENLSRAFFTAQRSVGGASAIGHPSVSLLN